MFAPISPTRARTLSSHLMNSTAIAVLTIAGILAGRGEAFATPAGGTVAAGGGTIVTTTTPTGTLTTITQPGQKGVYTWTGMNTSSGDTVQYVESSRSAVALNIISGGQTTFNGNLLANGGVWFLNQSGMLFGNATVNVGSLLLSTAGISNPTGDGFFTNTSGHYVFDQAGLLTAKITLDNTSVTANGDGTGNNGDISIMAPSIAVQNHSYVSTGSGAIVLYAGETFTTDFNGDGLINYQIIGPQITSPVSEVAPGETSAIFVGTGSTISTSPNTNNRVILGANIAQSVVLDNVINLGGLDISQYSFNNPEQTQLSNFMWAAAVVSPSVTPPSTTPLGAATEPTIVQNIVIPPLTRPFASLGDETVNDTVVNPREANVTYERPYLVNLPTSLAQGKLTLSSSSGAAGSPTNLGNLSPAAGGDMANNEQDNLGSLSPSAGGSIADAPSSIGCVNAFLDSAWFGDQAHRCIE